MKSGKNYNYYIKIIQGRILCEKVAVQTILGLEQEITTLYYYCPICGAHKKYYNDIPIKINKSRYE